jgi:hypothetical protein
MSSIPDLVLGAAACKTRKRKDKRERKKEREKLERRGSTSSSMTTKKPSTDGKKHPNRGPLKLVRNTLNGATLVGVFHMTATACNARRIRPTCIFASGLFSRNGA